MVLVSCKASQLHVESKPGGNDPFGMHGRLDRVDSIAVRSLRTLKLDV